MNLPHQGAAASCRSCLKRRHPSYRRDAPFYIGPACRSLATLPPKGTRRAGALKCPFTLCRSAKGHAASRLQDGGQNRADVSSGTSYPRDPLHTGCPLSRPAKAVHSKTRLSAADDIKPWRLSARLLQFDSHLHNVFGTAAHEQTVAHLNLCVPVRNDRIFSAVDA